MRQQPYNERLVSVPFSKTECGTDFYINTGHGSEIRGVLTAYEAFKTDFFELFFFRKAAGFVLLDTGRIDLHDGMALAVSPHQRQEWHVSDDRLDFDFLIFREDFMWTFLADKFFTYRLLYCYQTDTPPFIDAQAGKMDAYLGLTAKIKAELRRPVADSYHMIVALLYYLLITLNRDYAAFYGLPFGVPKSNRAFVYKDLLEKNIRKAQRVTDYADMMKISRTALDNAVAYQFGVSPAHLLRQKLLAEIKNDFLFTETSVSQLADSFGFSDPSHLMRFFKGQTGMTFSQYKRYYQAGMKDV